MNNEKKRWTENFALGGAALAVALCAGVFGIGGVKASTLAAKPTAYYEQSMASDFTARETAAQTIVTLAESSGGDAALIAQAKTGIEQSRAAQTPAEKYRAGNAMKLAVELLYQSLPESERDAKGSAAQMAWSEFTSRTSILSHSIPEYNALVQQAQSAAADFPGRLFIQEPLEEMQ